MKSVRAKDGSGEPPAPGRNGERDFHGERRTNDTHESTTDPDARLVRKGPGREAKLGFMGHALMENRNGLVVDACLTRADGHAELVAALHMIEPRTDRPRRITLGADKGYDAEDFVNELRSLNVAPHVAAKVTRSAGDGRTTRHAGYRASQIVRKRIEEAFGCAKATAGCRKTRHRGLGRVGWQFTLTMQPTTSSASPSSWPRPHDYRSPETSAARGTHAVPSEDARPGPLRPQKHRKPLL